jgi:hypothetical protein
VEGIWYQKRANVYWMEIFVSIGLAGRRDFDIGGRCIWKLGCMDKLRTDRLGR